MGLNKAFGQSEGNRRVLFKILNTAGTPTVVAVSPSGASVDMSIVDTGTGDYEVTIKNFKGPQGVANIQATAETISTFASVASRTYTNNDLAIVIKVENDASTATDGSVDVCAEAF